MKNGKCPAGEYYCYTNKECKPIPKGFMVDPEGMLRKENGASTTKEEKKMKSIKEEGLRDWFGKSKSKDGKKGWVNVVTGDSCASDKPGEGVPKCVSSAKRASMSKKERVAAQAAKRREDPGQQSKSGAAKPTMVKTDRKTRKEDMDINEAKDKKGKSSGKKDACYHKVKSRYSVWPSAYASGALVKCRKKGAANWGNSTKKEEMEGFYDLPELTETQIAALKYAGYEVEVLDEKCWKGYEKKGMKTMFGKRYPNCVKKKKTKKEEVEAVDEGLTGERYKEALKKGKQYSRMVSADPSKRATRGGRGGESDFGAGDRGTGNRSRRRRGMSVEEAVRIPSKTGNIYLVGFSWRGKYMMMKLFFPEVKRPTRDEVQSALDGIYPGCNVMRYDMTPYQPGEQLLHVEESEIEEGAAWTKKEGKNKSGGLNEKGRKSYERENPGSDLKAPSKKVGNPRRKSFCARMKGMKKKLTSKKTASDPDSRINKSLRAWNC
jgi:hypothetical protein